MNHVRTYNPSVRVGNWNEDVQLEEDTLKDFLERREKGQLLIQQSASLKDTALAPADVSVSRDGFVHIGDTFVLVNPDAEGRSASTLSITTNISGAIGVAASSCTDPSSRNTFVIASCDGAQHGDTLNYGQSFYITNKEGNLFLQSDRATFSKCARKSRHNEVNLTPNAGHLTQWKVQPFNPQIRMELEFTPVQANQKLIITHVKTNQNLNNEVAHVLKSPFGRESEMSTYTALDSHKAECDTNHWVFSMMVPGDGSMGTAPPTTQ